MLGFSATKKEVLQIWENSSKKWWHGGGSSPWRPSQNDIELYETLAGEKLRKSVLILGSTPELRDLAGLHSSNVTIIDISPSMIYCMTLLLKEANPINENWIKADWCKAPLPEKFFDAILGDMPWWVLSVSQQKELSCKTASLLKPDGVLVTRIRLRNPERKKADTEIALKMYLDRLDVNPDRHEMIRNAMVSYFHDITADTENLQINRARTKTVLLNAAERLPDSIHKDFLFEASRHLLSADWTSQTREEILAIIQKKFILEKELSAKDYDAEFYPVMKLIKK